jgi:hypothetical protein
MNRRDLLSGAVLAVGQRETPLHDCEAASVDLGGIAVWNDRDPYIPVVSGYPGLRLMLCERCDKLWVKRKAEGK